MFGYSRTMWQYVNIILLLIVSIDVQARTDDEIKLDFTKIVMSCTDTNPVGMEELAALQSYVIPKDTASKCLLACAYKKEGTMTSKGTYDLDHAYEVAKKEMNGDEKRYENSKKLADICAKVNDAKVSDGTKGCERAALIFKCITDNAPKLGFKL